MKKVFAMLLVFAVLFSVSGCFVVQREREREAVFEEYFEPELFSQDNPYAVYYNKYSSYILPDSCTRYLCWADIYRLSYEERFLARQEICAQYGQQFSDPYLTEYFSARDWYVPTTLDVTDQLSQQATMNLFLLEVYEATQDRSIQSWGNPYIDLCSADYVLEYSSSRSLTGADLEDLVSKELAIARNEIFARHGYIFSDKDLRAYFYSKPWYRPTTPASEFDFGCLSALETANVELIQEYEEITPATPGGNTGNTGTNAGVPSQVTVVDKYTYLLGKNCYHIPYVELSAAAAINQEMYEDCYELLKKHVFAYPDQQPLIYRMQYTVGRQGDVVSVLVYVYQDWGCDLIMVYNFSATTGRKLSTSQVFGAYGLSEAEGRDKIRAAMEAYWEPKLDIESEEFRDLMRECKDQTLADGNVSAWLPYIDAYGNLCFTGTIYSPAGAGAYEHLLDQSGNDLPGPGCPIHG